jgi:hypothetical protein
VCEQASLDDKLASEVEFWEELEDPKTSGVQVKKITSTADDGVEAFLSGIHAEIINLYSSLLANVRKAVMPLLKPCILRQAQKYPPKSYYLSIINHFIFNIDFNFFVFCTIKNNY